MSTPSRATVVKGAAWAIPTIALASAAPATAASPLPCPTVPGGSDWSLTYSGTLGPASTGAYSWNSAGTQWTVYRDNGSSSSTLTFTTTTTISNLIVGRSYSMRIPISWGYGNGVANQSTGATARVIVDGTTVLSRATRSSAGLGTSPGGATYTATSFTATSTSMQLQYQVIISAKTSQANDDIIMSVPTFANCV